MNKRFITYLRARGSGLRFDPYDKRDKLYAAPRRILPPAVDNREECTAVRNQGEEGACVGHGLVAVAEMLYWRKLGIPPDFSERWAYEKAKIYDEWEGADYEGTSIRGAVKAWAKTGICPEQYWPYVPQKPGAPKPNAGAQAKKYPLESYKRCNGLETIKHAIHYRGCVLAGVSIHEGWFKAGKTIPYKPKFSPQGGHAIAFVGYDDKKKILWIKNSWGTGWGFKGFSGLTYADANVNVIDAWMVSIPD